MKELEAEDLRVGEPLRVHAYQHLVALANDEVGSLPFVFICMLALAPESRDVPPSPSSFD